MRSPRFSIGDMVQHQLNVINSLTSVITSKAANGYQFKTGQRK